MMAISFAHGWKILKTIDAFAGGKMLRRLVQIALKRHTSPAQQACVRCTLTARELGEDLCDSI
jgi:hypothetical protein